MFNHFFTAPCVTGLTFISPVLHNEEQKQKMTSVDMGFLKSEV